MSGYVVGLAKKAMHISYGVRIMYGTNYISKTGYYHN